MKSSSLSDRLVWSRQLQSTHRRPCVTLQTPTSDTFFQLRSRCFSTGVCPRGAHVFWTSGVLVTPASSTNASRAFRRRTFFNPRPIPGDPGLNRRVVALHGPQLRLLTGEPQRREQIRQAFHAVLHAVLPADQFANPRTGPQLRVETVGSSPLQQSLPQSGFLPFCQLRCTTRTWPIGESFVALFPLSPYPVADRPLRHPHPRRNRRLSPTLIHQTHGLPPPPHPFVNTSLCVHPGPFTTSRSLGKDHSLRQ